MGGNVVPIADKVIGRLAVKYGLAVGEVEALYLRTPYDRALLERACRRLAGGEDFADVCVFIVVERK